MAHSRGSIGSGRPVLESLEQRDVPASITLDAGGTINIIGSGDGDIVNVSINHGNIFDKYDDKVNVTLTNNSPYTMVRTYDVWKFGGTYGPPYQQVKSISCALLDGNDTFDNKTYLPSYVWGGNGIDTLKGGSAEDSFDGEDGEDTLFGGMGNDSLTGGYGKDHLFGEHGNDILIGNHVDPLWVVKNDGVADELWGGAGADTFWWEHAKDRYGNSYNLDQPMDYYPVWDLDKYF